MGNKNGKLWTTDEEVSPEVLAKVRSRDAPTWKFSAEAEYYEILDQMPNASRLL